MTLKLCPAEETDLPLLAEMNKRLIKDEGSRNPMTIAELQQRMRGWWAGDWQIRLLIDERESVAGYAVYQFRVDDYFPERKVVYLRQLFVERERRSQGLGQRALQLLIEQEFPDDCTVEIEVLATNPKGYRFWSAVGFEAYCTTMKLNQRATSPITFGESVLDQSLSHCR